MATELLSLVKELVDHCKQRGEYPDGTARFGYNFVPLLDAAIAGADVAPEQPAATPSQVRRGWFRWPWVSRAEYERIIAASLINAENDRKRMAILQSMCNNRDDTISGMELAESRSKQNHADIVNRLKAEHDRDRESLHVVVKELREQLDEQAESHADQLKRERESCIADLKTVQDQRDELRAEWVKWNADRAKIAEENAALRTDRDAVVKSQAKMNAELDQLVAETLQAKGRAQILEDERDRARAIADQNRGHVGLMRMWISELHHKVEERLFRKPPTSPVGVTATDDIEAAMGSPVVEVASTGIMAGG